MAHSILKVDELLEKSIDNSFIDIRSDEQASHLYYELKEVRSTARTNERTRMHNAEVEIIVPSEWNKVCDISKEILLSYEQDIQVTGFYVEGLVRLYGLSGLIAGFKLLVSIIDNMKHLDNADSLAQQAASITGLNGSSEDGTLIMPINAISLVKVNGVDCAIWQHQQSQESSGKKGNNSKDKSLMTLEQINAALSAKTLQYFEEINGEIQVFNSLSDELEQKMHVVYGDFSPSLANINKAVDYYQKIVKNMIAIKNNKQNETLQNDPTDDIQAAAAPSSGGKSRAEMLRQLEEVMNYFTEHEPHSPISYVLKKTIAWVNMPLPELTQDLILEDGARFYSKILGLNENQDASTVQQHSEYD